MSTVLAQAVEELSGSTAELPSALRRLMVIASRIKAPDLSDWVRSELNGYSGDTPVPKYRQGAANVRLHFMGPFGSSRTIHVGAWDLPEAVRPSEDWGFLRYSVATLAELREGESDPAIALPAWWVSAARDLIAKGEMVSVEMMGLDTAGIVFSRTFITAVWTRFKRRHSASS